MANAGGDEPLHIAVLPWLAVGHLTPFLELSTRLSLLGHRVSFLSTPSNLPANNKNQIFPALLHLVPLTPSIPPPVSTTADLTDSTEHLRDRLRLSYDSLSSSLTEFLSSSVPPVDWLICDYAPHWAPPIARSLNVRSAFVALFSASTCAFFGPIDGGHKERSAPEDFTSVPDWVPFRTSVAFRPNELRRILPRATTAAAPEPPPPSAEAGNSTDKDKDGLKQFVGIIRDCDVVAVRGCNEFEGEWIELLGELYKKTVLPLGHFPPNYSISSNYGSDGEEYNGIFRWLDNIQEPGSVVYVAFGSEVRLEEEQVRELALGLELSGLPFVWALRWPTASPDDDVLPEGFLTRTAGRGIVRRGWVPQARILCHRAVGGFVTHCGWNSAVEGMQAGLALILVPMIFDQALNARLLEEKGVGKEVPRREEDGEFDGEGIAKTLRLVMVEEEGESVRIASREMKGVLGKKEVQDSYIVKFVDYLKEHRPTPVSL